MSASVFAPLPLSAPSNQPRSDSNFLGGAQHVDASFGACVSVNNDDDVDVARFVRDGGMDANGPRLSVVFVFVFVVVVVLVFVISSLDYFTRPRSNRRRRRSQLPRLPTSLAEWLGFSIERRYSLVKEGCPFIRLSMHLPIVVRDKQ